jgi:hypothetical protein
MIPPGAFPLLTEANHRITSPASRSYNCIAWAAGDTEAWWWPDSDEIGYWPAGAVREETVAGFVAAFRSLGYEVCESGVAESGVEKVAIFALRGLPTHAARQLPSGRWSSKLGPQEDIEHTLEALDGPVYGSIVAVLRRPREERR